MRFDARDNVFQMLSSELHVRMKDTGGYEWIPALDTTSTGTEDDDENIQMETVERSEEQQLQEHAVSSICGVEPKGSRYRVQWTNWNNKQRGEVVALASVLGSSFLIADYLMSATGIKRMNMLRKMFHSTASKKVQNRLNIINFVYKTWVAELTSATFPHKLIHRVVSLQLQQSGCPTRDSLVAHLRNKSGFPDRARFTAWIIPYGFHNRKVGSIVVPVHLMSTEQVSLLFKTRDRDTMTAYCDKLKTSMDKHRCISHWVLTAAADEQDDIVRNCDDDSYEVSAEFYKG